MELEPAVSGPRFSVIIPAFNAGNTLSACLEALDQQSVSKEDYEVIVVDDGSSDNTSKIAKSFDIKYIYQANRGPAAARNRGAREAKGEIILFTDADCLAGRTWMQEMVLPFEDPVVTAVKGSYKTRQTRLAARFAQAEFEDRYEFLQRQASIDMIDTYSAAFKKDIFQRMGGFDERFTVANNEDTDFSYRLAKAGHKLVFNPEAFVYHTHPDTLGKYLKVKFWRGYWRIVVYHRYPNKAVKDSYTPGTIKIQTLLMTIFLALISLSIFVSRMVYLSLLFCFMLMLSSLPFSLKVFRKQKVLGLISPLFIFLRALVFSVGGFLGFVRCLLKP